MTAQRRKFSEAEKLSILMEAAENGITAVLHKYNLSYSVYYNWKHKANSIKGPEKKVGPSMEQMRRLIEENNMLKKIVANQALELEMKHSRPDKDGEHR